MVASCGVSKADIDKIRKRSKSPNNGPWVSDYAEMAKKTVINRACKPIINSSNDRTLLRDCIRRSEAVIVDEEVSAEIAEQANTGEVLKIQEPVIDGEFSPDELASEPGTTQGKSAPPETTGKGPNW